MKPLLRVPIVALAPALVGVLASALVTGCGPAVQVEPSPFEEDDPRAEPSAPPAAAALPSTSEDISEPTVTERTRRGSVQRTVLDSLLDRGPGVFLRGVELAPHFRSGRFAGWKIVQFMPGESRFDPYDLRPGDVIGMINGRLIERPPHLSALWEELRTADAVAIEVRRGDDAFRLHFEVLGAAP